MTTTPIPSLSNATAAAGSRVASAIREAADKTGVSFDVLYNIARRESSLDPQAKAKTSSAAGLFQFIEQTWLGAVKSYGARHGLSVEAAAITRDADGRLSVSDPAQRKEILDLRFDARKAAGLAGELAAENRTALENRLGRPAGRVELYAAHFLGPSGAAKLLSAPPTASAAALLPVAAKANRPVFYGESGAKSVSEVVASIAKSLNAAAPQPTPVEAPVGGVRASDSTHDALDLARTFRARAADSINALSPLALAVWSSLDVAGAADGDRRAPI